jgi:hypothetical protein
MEKTSWLDHVRREVVHRVEEERRILQAITRKKANWVGHVLGRNCLLQHVA